MRETFENVGDVIKKFASILYTLEVLAAFITGIYLMAEEFLPVFWGILAILGSCGAALVPYFLFYGLGELIEQTTMNQRNTRSILRLLEDEKQSPAKTVHIASASPVQPTVKKDGPQHVWRCPHCGKGRTQDPCEYCGNQ